MERRTAFGKGSEMTAKLYGHVREGNTEMFLALLYIRLTSREIVFFFDRAANTGSRDVMT